MRRVAKPMSRGKEILATTSLREGTIPVTRLSVMRDTAPEGSLVSPRTRVSAFRTRLGILIWGTEAFIFFCTEDGGRKVLDIAGYGCRAPGIIVSGHAGEEDKHSRSYVVVIRPPKIHRSTQLCSLGHDSCCERRGYYTNPAYRHREHDCPFKEPAYVVRE